MRKRERILSVSFLIGLFFSNLCLAQSKPSLKGPPDVPTITLEEVVRTVLERNPSLQAAQETAEAKKQKILPATTLPDPKLSFVNMGDLAPPKLQKGDPSSGRFFGVEQEIPFPGKLGLKGKIAASEAEAEGWTSEQVRRQAVADVKAAFYDLYSICKSIDVVENQKNLLLHLAETAEARYRVGQGPQQDVLKAQVEVSKLLDRLAGLGQRREISKALLSSLMGQRSEEKIGTPADYQKAELLYTLEDLNRLARENSPKLKTQEREIDRNEYSVQLAKREYYPDFSVGFTYVDREDMREMYGLSMNAKVPLYFWRKQRPELEGSRLNLSSARKQKENILLNLSYEVKNAYVTATTSDKLVKLYGTALIPQARLTLDSAVASYQVGSVDYLTLLDSAITLLDFELKYYESLTDFQKALAQMEPIVGTELTQ